MDKFWEWMLKNKNIDGMDEHGGYILVADGVHQHTRATLYLGKRMLVGFMMEYLLENSDDHFVFEDETLKNFNHFFKEVKSKINEQV